MNNDIPHQVIPSAPESDPSRQFNDDEIYLVDIWRILVRRWKWIAVFTLISTAIAVAYALSAPKVYKAEAFLLPPLASDVEELNLLRIDQLRKIDKKTSTRVVYNKAITNFTSKQLQRRFLEEYNSGYFSGPQQGEILAEELILPQHFHEMLRVKRGKADFVTVSLEGRDPEQIAALLNGFVSFVKAEAVDELLKTLEVRVGVRKEAIKKEIEKVRQVASGRRLDRIVILQEALEVARQPEIRSFLQASPVLGHCDVGVVDQEGNPLFLRGVNILQAEIDMLKKRKNDDPFIKELRTLQIELAQLEEIGLSSGSYKSFRVDKLATQPQYPLKPKRKLIVALGAVLGLMLGVFTAFFVNFIETIRQKEST